MMVVLAHLVVRLSALNNKLFDENLLKKMVKRQTRAAIGKEINRGKYSFHTGLSSSRGPIFQWICSKNPREGNRSKLHGDSCLGGIADRKCSRDKHV